MKQRFKNLNRVFLAICVVFIIAGCQSNKTDTHQESGYIAVQEQGSFAVGGTVITASGEFDPIAHGAFSPVNQSSEGQTLHGDHAFVVYQKPVDSRILPLVFWHGMGQSMRTWQTTPDGREGFQ